MSLVLSATMGNTFTLYLTLLLYHLTNTVSGDSPSPYTPIDNIFLNCGSSGNSTAIDGRTWIGDINSKFLLDEQWLAKVSDFGLSKFGPILSKSHVSTMVKGTFGYLDLEYYRYQQLTEKSDVYAFGVVLCEVLCGKPAIVRAIEEEPISLAAWVLKYYHNGKLNQVVDPFLKGEITPNCLKKFGKITVSCLLDNGKKRPSMNDVVWFLEFSLELQESEEKDDMLDVAETDMKDDDELPLFPTSDVNESDDRIFNCSGKLSRTNSNSQVTVVSQGSFASNDSDGFMSSRVVFSETMLGT